MKLRIKRAISASLAFICSVLFLGSVVSGVDGTYRELYHGTAEENSFLFSPFRDGTVTGAAMDNTSGDKAFGIGSSFYKMEMPSGFKNGMVMTFENKSESLQDNSGGNGYTAEVAFDFRPDRTPANPVKIRLYPQDKSGTVHTGNRIIHLAFTTQADGATNLAVYDRSGSTVLGEVNLYTALGDYTKDKDHFFRIRAVFQPTDENGNMTRSLKLFVDGKQVLDTAYVDNAKEWRIAGIGIQGEAAYLGDLDNLTMCDYAGERIDAEGNGYINDDRAVAAIRGASILLSNAAEEDELTENLKNAITQAKDSFAKMETQADCDKLAEELEKEMKTYADEDTLKNFVFSDFTDEAMDMITKDLSLPTGYMPKTGGVFDCSFVSDKPEILSSTGVVTRPKYNETVKLTAKLTRDTDNAYLEKTFTVRVLADGDVTELGTVSDGQSISLPSGGQRILFGGIADVPVSISFGSANTFTLSEAGEFSIIADFQTNTLLLYSEGSVLETKPLEGDLQNVTVTGGTLSKAMIIKTDNYGYSVKNLLFSTSDGQPRAIPVSGGKVSQAEILCKDDTISSAEVLAAVYDNGALYNVAISKITESARYNETITLDFGAALPENIETATVKLFFLETLGSIKPIAPEFSYVVSEEVNFNPVIYIAGDSTACDYSDSFFPQTGWGQALGGFFDKSKVTVSNHAMGGRSAKSFIDEGRLDAIFSEIKPGDYLLIQFGHNDQKEGDLHTDADTTYKEYLTRYVEGARERGAIPIILTSVTRRIFTNGVFDNGNSLGKYPQAAKELAEEQNVPLIDMFDYSVNLVNQLGEEGSKDVFLFVNPNDERYAGDQRFAQSRYNKNEATEDNSHFQCYGAEVLASFVAEELDKLNLSLSPYYTPYTPVKP